MIQLGQQELNDILNGSAFLASGGGGSRAMGEEIRDWILDAFGTVELIDIEEVNPEGWSVVSFAGGAPSDITPSGTKIPALLPLKFSSHTLTPQRKGFSMSDLKAAIFYPFELLESTFQRSFSYVMPLEIGTGNTLLALWVAACKNIPIVDCDGAGRSIPDLSMLTYSSPQIPVYPAAMSNISTDPTQVGVAVLYADNIVKINNLLTDLIQTSEFGNSGVVSGYTMQGQTLLEQSPVISKSISEAQGVGAILRQATEQETDPVAALLDWYNNPPFTDTPRAFELFRGTIVKIEQENIGRLDRVTVVLDNGIEQICVLVLNENLIACRDSYPITGDIQEPIALGPDLICYVTPDGVPLTNIEIKEGQELVIVGLKSPEKVRQDESIVRGYLTILKALGYQGEYIPIEKLQRS